MSWTGRALTPRTLAVTTRWTSLTLALLLLASFGKACKSHASASAEPASSTSAGSLEPIAADTTVLLYANMGEADEDCACGQIIRSVRAAASKGVKVREIDARDKYKKAATSKQYRIMVAPAVLFLDTTGKVTRRFEGESSDTLKALDSALEQLEKR